MHQNEKALTKMSPDDAARVAAVMARIAKNDLEGLQVKKLRGFISRYRIRVGRYRIIFERIGPVNYIDTVTLRDDNTY
jgi:mRNA-degrading endonuclease RelE of RelBE toxin-antitoxin system